MSTLFLYDYRNFIFGYGDQACLLTVFLSFFIVKDSKASQEKLSNWAGMYLGVTMRIQREPKEPEIAQRFALGENEITNKKEGEFKIWAFVFFDGADSSPILAYLHLLLFRNRNIMRKIETIKVNTDLIWIVAEKIQEDFYSTEKRREPASTESPALGTTLVIVPD